MEIINNCNNKLLPSESIAFYKRHWVFVMFLDGNLSSMTNFPQNATQSMFYESTRILCNKKSYVRNKPLDKFKNIALFFISAKWNI